MTDYSQLSDFEINKRVAESLLIDHFANELEQLIETINGESGYYDPCNNPADAWPIIQRRGISLNYDGIDWIASDLFTDIKVSNNIEEHAGKPMRAAMICYLMALDAEKGHG